MMVVVGGGGIRGQKENRVCLPTESSFFFCICIFGRIVCLLYAGAVDTQ